VTGYKIYWGKSSGVYLQAKDTGIAVGNVLTYTVVGLTSGTAYFFAVTAVDNLGMESSYSNEVTKIMP
jgi:fibronectin type 3 domain-containing protein